MRKKNVLLLALLLAMTTLNAQIPEFDWGITYGNEMAEEITSSAVDQNGNVFITGSFIGSIDFDPGPGVFSMNSPGGGNSYVLQLDSFGNFVNAFSFKGTSTSNNWPSSIRISSDGDLVICGRFHKVVDFNPKSEKHELEADQMDAFVAKLSKQGELKWVHKIGGVGNDLAMDLDTDSNGNIYVTGYFSGKVDFDPGKDSSFREANGWNDAYIVKLTSEGDYVWAKTFGGETRAIGEQVRVHAGNVILGGTFEKAFDFNPGPGKDSLFSNGLYDVFLLKLDTQGQFVWARSWGNNHSDNFGDIHVTSTGSVLLTGSFAGQIDADPGPSESFIKAFSGYDAYLIKVDQSGQFQWAFPTGGSGSSGDKGIKVLTDSMNDIYYMGHFIGSPDFDPGSKTYTLTSKGKSDIFWQKLDSNGNFIWAISTGGREFESASNMNLMSGGILYTIGHFAGISDLDPGPGSKTFIARGAVDMFVVKLRPGVTNIPSIKPIHVKLYPNPTQGVIYLESSKGVPLQYRILDINGREISQKRSLGLWQNKIVLNGAPGVYILEIGTKHESQLYKVIKQ